MFPKSSFLFQMQFKKLVWKIYSLKKIKFCKPTYGFQYWPFWYILCNILRGLGGLVSVTKEHHVTFNIGISSKSFVTSITLKPFFAALRRGNSAGTCLRNKRALSPPNLHALHIYHSSTILIWYYGSLQYACSTQVTWTA